jgi:hypothetical protein
MHHERPPHAPGAHHGRDDDPGDDLPQPLVHGTPLPLGAEEQGVAEAPAADGDGFEELVVVVVGGHFLTTYS